MLIPSSRTLHPAFEDSPVRAPFLERVGSPIRIAHDGPKEKQARRSCVCLLMRRLRFFWRLQRQPSFPRTPLGAYMCTPRRESGSSSLVDKGGGVLGRGGRRSTHRRAPASRRRFPCIHRRRTCPPADSYRGEP